MFAGFQPAPIEPWPATAADPCNNVPGEPNCRGQSVSALAKQYGSLNAAAAVLGYPSAATLQNAIAEYCAA